MVKRNEKVVLIGRKGNEFWFVDSVFWHRADFYGCTGTTVWPVSSEQVEEMLSTDSLADRFGYYWAEQAQIKPDCDDCACGPNEEGCEYCGYQSLNSLCADIARFDGLNAVVDYPGHEYEEILAEFIDDLETVDCSGCGRIFHGDPDFDEVYNRKALVAILAYEDGAVSYDYVNRILEAL